MIQEHSAFDNVYVPVMSKPVPKADPPPPPADAPKEAETPAATPKEGEIPADAPKEGEKMEVDPPADSATMEVD